MKMSQYTSSFLNAEDIKEPTVITIQEIKEEKVGGENRPVLYSDLDQGIVLNKTCIEKLIELTGSEDSDDWIDKQVTVYNDHSVEFRGKKVGGIRFRAAKPNGKNSNVAPAKSGARAAGGSRGSGSDDEVPFE